MLMSASSTWTVSEVFTLFDCITCIGIDFKQHPRVKYLACAVASPGIPRTSKMEDFAMLVNG